MGFIRLEKQRANQGRKELFHFSLDKPGTICINIQQFVAAHPRGGKDHFNERPITKWLEHSGTRE
jgi:hypothetical protein